jgi:hypothetical protein
MARASEKNIALTREIADRDWRPDLSFTFSTVGNVDFTDKVMTLRLPFLWRNSGGSPALQIYYRGLINRSDKPCISPDEENREISFTIWPKGDITDYIDFKTKDCNFDNDSFYLHLGFKYKDRNNKEYLVEEVLFCKITHGEIVLLRTIKDFEYDWIRKQWK